MEEKIDLKVFEDNKEELKAYMRSVSSNNKVCVAPHHANVRRKDPAALFCAGLMERFGLSLAEMYFLIVKKDLQDLHLYCEVCGKRIPKLIVDKKYCSAKCMHNSEEYQKAIKEGIEEKNRRLEDLKKSIIAGVAKETKDFSFTDMKSRLAELQQYLSSLSNKPGQVNVSRHRKALLDMTSIAVFIEQMMYKYDLTLEEINLLVKVSFTKSVFCKTCGKRLDDISRDYCSLSCMKKDPGIQAKYEQTCMERYGVKNAAQSAEIKDRIKDTCQERYGVDFAFQDEGVKAKLKETWLEKYGVDNPNKDKTVRDKLNRTVKTKKYDFFLRFLDTLNLELLDSYQDYLDYDKLHLKCKKCGTQYEATFSVSNQLVDRCPDCTKPFSSIAEGEILYFVKGLVGDGVKVLPRDHSTIHPYELDICVPEKHLAIEYDGQYWHSSNIRGVDKTYHLTKTELCKAKGIRLLHIFDHEWINKQEIVKSVIKSHLGIYDRRIFARKCDGRLLSDSEYREFLMLNHLQGYAPATIRMGLFYDDELLACVGIGKSRFKEGEIELIRFCNALNTKVIGGLSRLVKHCRGPKLFSYVDRRYFDGSGYENAGFNFVSKSDPGYVYVRGSEVLSRMQCQKHRLPDLLGDKFDPSLTEAENMALSGYCQLYDCGMLKYCYASDNN